MGLHVGIVEDDENIRNIVKAYLEKEDYQVTISASGEEALDLWQSNPPDMWILDIMLPGMNGYDFCKRIRAESDVPIIIISAKDEEIDKILGIELGGDDYLTKPFSPRELVARIKRLFKRTELTQKNTPQLQTTIQVGQLKIYTDERRVLWFDKEKDITSKEFDMLLLFVRDIGRAFSREELLDKLWGMDYFGSDRAVDDLVKRLRKKLKDIPIETVWGYGYRYKHSEA